MQGWVEAIRYPTNPLDLGFRSSFLAVTGADLRAAAAACALQLRWLGCGGWGRQGHWLGLLD
jgi:hypothetical protein